MYAMVGTRVDLAYVVSIMSQYISKARAIPLATIKKIMKYLKGSLYFKLYLESNNITLHSYCNADWIRVANDRRSITRYVFFLGMKAVL